MRKPAFCICENKGADQLCGNRTADQRLCFRCIRTEQSLFFLYPKFRASSNLQWLYSPVCVGPGRKPRRPVFSQRGSFIADGQLLRKSPVAYSDGVYEPSGADRPNPFAISNAAHNGRRGLSSLRHRTAFMVFFGELHYSFTIIETSPYDNNPKFTPNIKWSFLDNIQFLTAKSH